MNNDALIHIISLASNTSGDKLIDFLERYHLQGLIEATTEQLQEYIETEHLNKEVTEKCQMPTGVYVAVQSSLRVDKFALTARVNT